MDKDIALTILLEHVIRPHLKHASFDATSTRVALDICVAMTVLTAKPWTIAPHPLKHGWHVIVEWSVS